MTDYMMDSVQQMLDVIALLLIVGSFIGFLGWKPYGWHCMVAYLWYRAVCQLLLMTYASYGVYSVPSAVGSFLGTLLFTVLVHIYYKKRQPLFFPYGTVGEQESRRLSAAPLSDRVCRACGFRLQEGDRFCVMCGTRMESFARPSLLQENTEDRKIIYETDASGARVFRVETTVPSVLEEYRKYKEAAREKEPERPGNRWRASVVVAVVLFLLAAAAVLFLALSGPGTEAV